MKKKVTAKQQADLDALEVALVLTESGRASSSKPLVHVAAALRGTTAVRETPRAQTKDRMLRAFAASTTPVSVSAGTQDGDTAAVHTASVVMPDGARVRLADVEQIDAARAASIGERLWDARPAAVRYSAE